MGEPKSYVEREREIIAHWQDEMQHKWGHVVDPLAMGHILKDELEAQQKNLDRARNEYEQYVAWQYSMSPKVAGRIVGSVGTAGFIYGMTHPRPPMLFDFGTEADSD